MPGVQAPAGPYQPRGTHSVELGRLFSCCSIRIRETGQGGPGRGSGGPTVPSPPGHRHGSGARARRAGRAPLRAVGGGGLAPGARTTHHPTPPVFGGISGSKGKCGPRGCGAPLGFLATHLPVFTLGFSSQGAPRICSWGFLDSAYRRAAQQGHPGRSASSTRHLPQGPPHSTQARSGLSSEFQDNDRPRGPSVPGACAVSLFLGRFLLKCQQWFEGGTGGGGEQKSLGPGPGLLQDLRQCLRGRCWVLGCLSELACPILSDPCH